MAFKKFRSVKLLPNQSLRGDPNLPIGVFAVDLVMVSQVKIREVGIKETTESSLLRERLKMATRGPTNSLKPFSL